MKYFKHLLLLPLFLCLLPSCASFAGLGGKAHYVQNFSDTQADTVAPDGTRSPGQSTKYSLDIKGPAGMKWEEITGMGYEWDDVHGKIAINSQSKADTLATAEAIKAVVPALTETLTDAITNAVLQGMQFAAPLIGQAQAGKQTNEAAKIQLDAATKTQLIELLKSLSTQVSASPLPVGDGVRLLEKPVSVPSAGAGAKVAPSKVEEKPSNPQSVAPPLAPVEP